MVGLVKSSRGDRGGRETEEGGREGGRETEEGGREGGRG